MSCGEVQKRLHDFLEDILSESLHEEIRKHLAGCSPCQQHALRLGSFTTDLKRLGEAELPEDFAQEVLKIFQKKGMGEKVQIPWQRLLSLATFFVLAGWAVYLGWPQLASVKMAKKKEGLADDKKLALLQLELIDKRLAKVTEKLGSVEESASQNADRPKVLSLRPFHWHLELENPEEEKALRTKIRDEGIAVKYQTLDFLILEMKQKVFDDFFRELEAKSLFEKNKVPIRLEKIPVSKNPVELSLLLKREYTPKKPPEALHWHVNFLRKDSYLLHEELLKKGWRFRFDSPELWVLEVLQEEYLELLKLMKLRSAVIASGQPPEVLEKSPFLIEIYIQEG
ncbi:MAG: zf-HC2 domain-containing protein [Candidatus Omnitrophica bacterium]|nr:zf-HC2 domain-containing protein [Candidatus Omnitrophota bacterium]